MLKDDLREFAKQTAGLAFPSSNGAVDLPINQDPNNICTYITPCDGWVCVYAEGNGVLVDVYSHGALGVLSETYSTFAKGFTQCAKGDTVFYRIQRTSLVTWIVKFIPARNS